MWRHLTNNPLGKYFFIPSTESFKGILPETVTRLIYLNTFMDYGNNKLMMTERVPNQQFYIDGVRKLYRATKTKYHSRLDYLFKMLPFINIEYNLLCYPEFTMETNLEKIELMSMAEFCDWIDYDVKHLNNLVSEYREIRFDVGGRQERFCALSYNGINKKNARICINPHILYSGSDYSKVEILGAFCRP